MKEIAWMSLNSIRKFITDDRKYCFEVFGYDFLIDQELNVWIIEVNTNPCIEESSDILKVYLPRMLGIIISNINF